MHAKRLYVFIRSCLKKKTLEQLNLYLIYPSLYISEEAVEIPEPDYDGAQQTRPLGRSHTFNMGKNLHSKATINTMIT